MKAHGFINTAGDLLDRIVAICEEMEEVGETPSLLSEYNDLTKRFNNLLNDSKKKTN